MSGNRFRSILDLKVWLLHKRGTVQLRCGTCLWVECPMVMSDRACMNTPSTRLKTGPELSDSTH